MLLKIDFESETPIYLQVRNQLIEGIAKGELGPGDSLPSVRQLAEDIGINMHTVNKVYSIMKSDGFITLDRRKGAIVSKDTPLNSEYLKKLKDELSPIAAESYCRGMAEEEFIKICRGIFESFKGGE